MPLCGGVQGKHASALATELLGSRNPRSRACAPAPGSAVAVQDDRSLATAFLEGRALRGGQPQESHPAARSRACTARSQSRTARLRAVHTNLGRAASPSLPHSLTRSLTLSPPLTQSLFCGQVFLKTRSSCALGVRCVRTVLLWPCDRPPQPRADLHSPWPTTLIGWPRV
jgi:hypothetical protein